jgi:dihydrofolate reductase
MSARGAVFIATSLDGFIAREDGRIDWLLQANEAVPPGEDCGYAAFMATVDAIVMGRATFEQVLAFADWPYGTTPLMVWSRRLQALPAGLPPTVSLHAGSATELAAHAAQHGHGRLYVDGGRTIQAFLAAHLIDEPTITVIPILLGRGRPLFGGMGPDVHLTHLSTQAWPFGFVQNRYAVAAPA